MPITEITWGPDDQGMMGYPYPTSTTVAVPGPGVTQTQFFAAPGSFAFVNYITIPNPVINLLNIDGGITHTRDISDLDSRFPFVSYGFANSDTHVFVRTNSNTGTPGDSIISIFDENLLMVDQITISSGAGVLASVFGWSGGYCTLFEPQSDFNVYDNEGNFLHSVATGGAIVNAETIPINSFGMFEVRSGQHYVTARPLPAAATVMYLADESGITAGPSVNVVDVSLYVALSTNLFYSFGDDPSPGAYDQGVWNMTTNEFLFTPTTGDILGALNPSA